MQKHRTSLNSIGTAAPQDIASHLESIIQAHYAEEDVTSGNSNSHPHQQRDVDDTDDDDYNNDSSHNDISDPILSDLLSFTPMALELIHNGAKIPGFIQREQDLKKQNAELQHKVQKLQKDVEQTPTYILQISELEQQNATLEAQAETTMEKLESVQLNNTLLLDQIKRLNKDIEDVRERAANRKSVYKTRIEALEKALADEMAVATETGEEIRKKQVFMPRKTMTVPPCSSRDTPAGEVAARNPPDTSTSTTAMPSRSAASVPLATGPAFNSLKTPYTAQNNAARTSFPTPELPSSSKPVIPTRHVESAKIIDPRPLPPGERISVEERRGKRTDVPQISESGTVDETSLRKGPTRENIQAGSKPKRGGDGELASGGSHKKQKLPDPPVDSFGFHLW
jgi:hypothetical protein